MVDWKHRPNFPPRAEFTIGGGDFPTSNKTHDRGGGKFSDLHAQLFTNSSFKKSILFTKLFHATKIKNCHSKKLVDYSPTREMLATLLSIPAERLHGRAVKALANYFGGPGSIPSTSCRRTKAVKYSLPCLMLP